MDRPKLVYVAYEFWQSLMSKLLIGSVLFCKLIQLIGLHCNYSSNSCWLKKLSEELSRLKTMCIQIKDHCKYDLQEFDRQSSQSFCRLFFNQLDFDQTSCTDLHSLIFSVTRQTTVSRNILKEFHLFNLLGSPRCSESLEEITRIACEEAMTYTHSNVVSNSLHMIASSNWNE